MWTLSILGTDINRNGLTFAKEAIYNEKSIAYLPKEYLSKYFRVQGSNYALSPRVREMVKFEQHNLARDPYLYEEMKDVDILFCRNVTIYFDAETTRRVIDRFYNCLAPDGYLFLGHTETLWQVTNRFERVEYPQTFIYTRRRSPVLDETLKPFIAVPEVTLKDLTSPPREEREKQASKKRPVSHKSPAGSPRPSSKTGGPRNGTVLRTSLTQAALLANEARYGEAVEILGKVVEADNLSVEAYYLLGTLCYKSNDLQGAETHFRKVIYVDPDSALAYFNLGNLYLYQGKHREASREFRNAARLLEKRPKEEPVRFCSDFTAEFLLRACRNNLLEISKRGEGHE
jgi:chemotaxis protein methyltransferase CheR